MDAFAAYLLFISANNMNDKIVLAITKNEYFAPENKSTGFITHISPTGFLHPNNE